MVDTAVVVGEDVVYVDDLRGRVFRGKVKAMADGGSDGVGVRRRG